MTSRIHEIETTDGAIRFSETSTGKVTVLGRIHINHDASPGAFQTFFAEMKRAVPGVRQIDIELYGENFETFRHNVHGDDKKTQIDAIKMTKLYRAIVDNLGLKRVIGVKDAAYDGVEVTLGR